MSAELPQWRTGGRARAALHLSSLRPASGVYHGNKGMLEQLTVRRGDTYDAEELSKYKAAIQTQLEDDELKYRALKDSLDMQDKHVNSLTHIFDAYDDRLAHLSDSIQPLHEMITRLTKVLSNIQNTNQSFINVMSHFDVYADVRGYIENSSNLKDLDSYIDKMEKAKNAQTYFEENQLRGGQETLRELTELVEIGANKMTQNFYDVLKHNNRKCNFSGVFEGLNVDIEDELGKLLMDEETIDRLHKIAHFMGKIKDDAYLARYIEIRSRDTLSSLISLSYDDKVRTTGHDKGGGLKPGGLAMGLGMRQGTVRDTRDGPVRHENLQVTCLELKPDATRRFYEQGTHSFLKAIEIFTKLLLREKMQAKKILPRGQTSLKTFGHSVMKCVNVFVETGQNVLAEAQSRTRAGRENFHLFDILSELKGADFNELVQVLGVESGPGHLLLGLIDEYVEACKRIFNEFEAELKKNSSRVPEDGTVHELTSNTMSFFNRVWVYHDTADTVLLTSGKDRGKVGDWFSRALNTLQQCLQTKSTQYNDKTLAIVFLLNNFHYVLKTCRNSDFFDDLGHGFDKIFSGVVNSQIESYKTSWTRCLNYLLEEPLDSSLKFSKNVKDDIKERFKGFNTEFEEIRQRQMKYSVPDDELKVFLRKLNEEILLPHYKDFRSRADKIHFSKNTQKYIKYSVQSLKIMLNKFFDPNANI